MFQNLSARIQGRFWQWIDRRSSMAAEQVFGQKNIYVLPTQYGVGYCLLILFLFVTAVNYQNNLLYITTFLFVALFVIAIWMTYRNMSGLVMSVDSSRDNYVSLPVEYTFKLRKTNHQPTLALMVINNEGQSHRVDVEGNGSSRISIGSLYVTRGKKHPGRLQLKSVYPLGLIKAWGYANLDVVAWVYPKPQEGAVPSGEGDDNEQESLSRSRRSGLDVSGIKPYRPGDSMGQISWKHFASRNELYVKEREPVFASLSVLDFDALDGISTEQRLSVLCFHVRSYADSGRMFELKLPGKRVAMGQGQSHLIECLRTLAEYQ